EIDRRVVFRTAGVHLAPGHADLAVPLPVVPTREDELESEPADEGRLSTAWLAEDDQPAVAPERIPQGDGLFRRGGVRTTENRAMPRHVLVDQEQLAAEGGEVGLGRVLVERAGELDHFEVEQLAGLEPFVGRGPVAA